LSIKINSSNLKLNFHKKYLKLEKLINYFRKIILMHYVKMLISTFHFTFNLFYPEKLAYLFTNYAH